ncbi:peptidoglycan DD-metalloendopeptidase family protein [Hyphococcus flavus]|uniref:Peptidoglycan DD-metalloendopeptidase family protein n=1 Tax=Hyphococcus flavus TaxID=1866326 RepID=A0AAE9ZD99_9PROT|nr:peptidoglycan DD-metalloendopeptidase family protein [Hyphococcus flavus]WDI32903.1 peptidoglycan DD-metalloendopeptidase family protein [Hyphococcus flavus]
MMRFFFAFAIALFSIVGAAAQVEPEDLQEVEQQLRERAEEEKRLRNEAEARKKEVAALRHRLIETANSLQDAERKIASLEDSIAALETEKAEAETALRNESANLSEVLAALQSLELSRPPALLVTPEDANKAARAAMLLSGAAPEVEARAARLREAIERLSDLAADLDRDRASYAETNQELIARRDVLAELMAQKEQERDVAEALAASAQRETARIAAQASTLREMIERLSRLAHSITPRIKPAPPKANEPERAAPTAPTIKREAPQPFVGSMAFDKALGALRPPVAGRVTGEYGKQRPEGGRFEGMRFAVRDQAIVTAPFEGRVRFAMEWRPVGNMIVLDVGEGYHILLIGVGRILVQEHQWITAGEPVAEMAGGGASLDLEIRKNGEPVNPALWLSRKSMDELAL